MINEAYVQLDNDLADPFTGGIATTFYNVNSWVELHNPMIDDSSNTTYGSGYGRNDTKAILQDGSGNPLYRLLVCKDNINANITDPRNTLGDPDFDPTTGASVPGSKVRNTLGSWTKSTPDPESLLVRPAATAAASYQESHFEEMQVFPTSSPNRGSPAAPIQRPCRTCSRRVL